MRIAYYVTKSAALLEGQDAYGWQLVTIPSGTLTREERAMLAAYGDKSLPAYRREVDAGHAPGGADYAIGGTYFHPGSGGESETTCTPATVGRASVESVRAALGALHAWDAAYERGREAHEEGLRAKARKQAERCLEAARTGGDGVGSPTIVRVQGAATHYGRRVDRFYVAPALTTPAEVRGAMTPEERAVVDAAQARAAIAAANANAELEAAETAEHEREQEERARLARALFEWATSHGSELLRKRVANGFRWEPLARQEYGDQVAATLERLEGFSETRPTGELQDVDAPELGELEALEAARAALGGESDRLSVGLAYVRGRKGGERLVQVEVTCPDGVVVSRFFRIKQEVGR